MVQLSRRSELLLGLVGLLLSAGALTAVLSLLIWPERVHTERLQLRMFSTAAEVDLMVYETYWPSSPQYACKQAAPCCLQMKFTILPPPTFPSYVNLPYGEATSTTPELGHQEACRLGVAFAKRLEERPVLFIAKDNDNKVFFNESSGANIAEYWQTWPGADPDQPSLVVDERRGDGVTIGAGFLLAVCCVGLTLSSALLILRIYDDLHTIRAGAAAGEEGMRRAEFSRLNNDEEQEQAALADRGALTGDSGGFADSRSQTRAHPTHELGDFDGDIEMEEQRLSRGHGSGGDADPPSRSARSSANAAALEEQPGGFGEQVR